MSRKEGRIVHEQACGLSLVESNGPDAGTRWACNMRWSIERADGSEGARGPEWAMRRRFALAVSDRAARVKV